MISQTSIQIVKSTATVVAMHAEAITRRFYTLMFEANPETQAYFNPAHQHSGGQQRALAGAICAYAANIDNLAALEPAVELIAQKHCSLGIRPEHYPIVGKHLLVAIKHILGDAATDEVITAWGEAYGMLAEVFIAREAQIYREQSTVPGGWNGYRRFIVDRKCQENEYIASFYLRPEDGGQLAVYKPGQYITVKIDPSKLATPPRNYSLSDRPGLDNYRISVKRESSSSREAPAGLVSNYLHDRVSEGDVLDIGPPCGEFTLELERIADRPIVLISGGIGITPLLSMLKHMVHRQANTPIRFLHAARNSRHHAFAEDVRRLATECPNISTHFRYDAPLADDVRHGHCDSVGLVDMRLLKELLPTNNANCFVCGPKPFMSRILDSLEQLGVPLSQIHYEFFGPKQDMRPANSIRLTTKSTALRTTEMAGSEQDHERYARL